MKHLISPHVAHLFRTLLIIVVSVIHGAGGFAQAVPDPKEIYLISDVQEPMRVEKWVGKPYRNEEATDSLYADMVRLKPRQVFLLGDLASAGSNNRAWAPLDRFLNALHRAGAQVHAIPGNHEYMGEKEGMRNFTRRFGEKSLHGYCVRVDSMVLVMLNSNFKKLRPEEVSKQLVWYNTVMDSLEDDRVTRAIIVCTHHAPFSNSRVVGSSAPVAGLIVPGFEKSKKTVLLISGHSHNLEYFARPRGKHFLVIGGGGGIAQPLLAMDKRVHHDLLGQEVKPLYFYLVMKRKENSLELVARGFKRDFRFFELEIATLTLN